MKAFCLIICSVGIFLSAKAQPQVTLRLAFNAERNQYEVFATPNFSARNFTWGPSQVSVVLPVGQSKDPLSVKSTVAGSWSDNSIVLQPQSAPNALFHGITSPGGKLNMTAGEEFLLFDFALPAGYVENVRLFDNASDPGSAQPGMKGGDFRSYMSDEKGADYLVVKSAPALLSVTQGVLTAPLTDEQPLQVVAYPNPTTSGTFRLFLKGFDSSETVTLHFHSIMGIEQKRLTDKVGNLTGRAISVPDLNAPYWLVVLERTLTNERFSQKIWIQN